MGTDKNIAFALNGAVLKWIAVITMTIDHIGAVVVGNGILCFGDPEKLMQILGTSDGHRWYIFYLCLRTVGRVAFPLFCFLLVEGFLHTRNANRYLLNLTAFAFISEIPFDFANFGKLLEFSYQNVYFTLALGLLTMMGIKQYEGRNRTQALIAVLGGVAAMLLKTDYNIIGIAMIVSFYLLRDNKKHRLIVAGGIAFVESLLQFGFAALAMIPIHFYNGERGKSGGKYFYYLFYPAHLLILTGIRILFFG